MRVIYNNFIPFPGFVAMTFYNIIFARKEYETLNGRVINHESIHEAQQRDFCKWIPLGGTIFYIWYLIEFFIRMILYPFTKKDAYRNISFEREAYDNEKDGNYLQTRKKFAGFKRIRK